MFIITAPVINGCSVLPNFITEEEEKVLLRYIDEQLWLTDLQRRVQHYGYRYNYQKRRLGRNDNLGELPAWLQQLASRLYSEEHFSAVPDQVIVNEYQPAQGIAPHIDSVENFGGTVASLSLASDCVMDFSKPNTREKVSTVLPRRSLMILQHDARYQWQHSIAKRKNDVLSGIKVPRQRRVSLTFRTIT